MVSIHLSRLLGERRMTQAELARLTGIRPATIHEWYHELIERVNVDHIDLICEALGCTIPELLEFTPNRQKRVGTELVQTNRKRYNTPQKKSKH